MKQIIVKWTSWVQDVKEITQKYDENQGEAKDLEKQDFTQQKPLEGATNQVWFATPENTKDSSKLDQFNKRVYNLIMDCKEKERLDPTKSEEMKQDFLNLFDWTCTQFNKEQKKDIGKLFGEIPLYLRKT